MASPHLQPGKKNDREPKKACNFFCASNSRIGSGFRERERLCRRNSARCLQKGPGSRKNRNSTKAWTDTRVPSTVCTTSTSLPPSPHTRHHHHHQWRRDSAVAMDDGDRGSGAALRREAPPQHEQGGASSPLPSPPSPHPALPSLLPPPPHTTTSTTRRLFCSRLTGVTQLTSGDGTQLSLWTVIAAAALRCSEETAACVHGSGMCVRRLSWLSALTRWSRTTPYGDRRREVAGRRQGSRRTLAHGHRRPFLQGCGEHLCLR